MSNSSYQLEIIDGIAEIPAADWNALVPPDAPPFLKHEFLIALEACACVGKSTGWQVAHLILRSEGNRRLLGAVPLYLKQHSYGEYVFDWSWAQAYEQSGLKYYPKMLSAIPFTPVQGPRILCAKSANADRVRNALLQGLKEIATQNQLSSIHILFPAPTEIASITAQGFMLRDSVQFHWENQDYQNFEQFLLALNMKRRKNIRRERAIVAKQGFSFSHIPGRSTTAEDWTFFYRCYENTYLEHHSTPYLNEAFFTSLALSMPDNLHLIVASQGDERVACSLLVVDKPNAKAYGRYWGAIGHFDCLHFETAYYQALEYCIKEGIQVFEGGAQGEHKMARGFMPHTIHSAHWIADQQFSKAVHHFLEREHLGIANYVDELSEHSPLKSSKVAS